MEIQSKNSIWVDYNNNDYLFPDTATIHSLFEEQAAEFPLNIALIFQGQRITYQDFNEKSNQLARFLIDAGVTGDTIVAIMTEPSLEMAIGIMGILKAGGAYLPIDPSYPEDRIQYILHDSEACLVLTQSHLPHGLIKKQEVVFLDRIDISRKAKSNLDIIISSRNLAYLIYTSGTTGKPKGVMVEHRSVVNTLFYRKNEYQITPDDTAMEFFSFAFDGFVTIFFTPLISGAKVVILSKDEIHDAEKIRQIIVQNKVTNIISVPALYGMLLDSLTPDEMRSLKIVTLAGDTIPEKLVGDSYRKSSSTEISVEYGVTEAAVMSTIYRHQEKNTEIKIGKPIGNTKIFILDDDFKMVLPGTPGELCIGGIGLARGYINKPDLTAKKFVPNPHCPGEKIYRTGDLAKWHTDGNIVFLGRKDNQVKIRGFRIEISEIENRLLEYDGILQALVIARNHHEGHKYLCAYYLSDREIEIERLKHFLALQLPVYMIPHFIIKINEIPLTPNGKIDRNALPDPRLVHKKSEYRAPKTYLEKTVVDIWEQVLEIKKISLIDNFFHLGGDSIKAMQIAARLLSAGYKLKVRDLVNNPSPEGIIPYIKNMKSNHPQNAEESGVVPLTPIQKWFFDNNFTHKHHWNQAYVIHSHRPLDANHLEAAMNVLLKHHDVLRTIFSEQGSSVQQYIRLSAAVRFKPEVYDYRGIPEHRDVVSETIDAVQKSFDLQNGLLIKAALFRTDDGDQLLIVAHHLIIDSVSFVILLDDLIDAYTALENGREVIFPDKTTSYKEWACKLTEIANDPSITREIPYWKNILQCSTGLLAEDCPTGENTFQNSETATICLTKSETHDLVNLANKAYNTKINELLLAALVISIKKHTGKNEMLINLEGHGREELFDELDITRTIGWFTASFPVLFKSAENFDMEKSIVTVKETLRNIPKNGIGYGILNYLTVEPGLSGIRIKPEINFNYMGEIDISRQRGTFQIEEVDLSSCISGKAARNFQWDIYGLIENGKLVIHINYDKNQYQRDAVIGFGITLKEQILFIIDHCLSRAYSEFTKSDFSLDGFTDDQFELVKRKLKVDLQSDNIKEIYFLTPMQEGMLYSGISCQSSDLYFQQMRIGLSGTIEYGHLETAFDLLVKKYDILRTLFLWEQIPRPVQVVFKERVSRLNVLDISDAAIHKKPRMIEEIFQADRDATFHLDSEPLLRVKLVKTSATDFILLISFHHIIMDGWCFGFLFDEFLDIIAKLKSGTRIEIDPAIPYSRYIKWLSSFDKEAARIYWQEYLAGYELPVYIGRSFQTMNSKSNIREKYIEIEEQLGTDIINFAGKHETTCNTIFQSAWGVLLQHYRMQYDVVFGYVVSGRPPEIEAVEKIAGLFINTIPLRIKTGPDSTYSELVQRVKADNIDSRPHESLALAEIQSTSAVKRGLFDHILVFENFPTGQFVHNREIKKHVGFEITGIEVLEKTEYNLTITITPREQSFAILFQYTGDFDQAWIDIIGNYFVNLIRSLITHCHQKIGDLNFTSAREKELILKTSNHSAAKQQPLNSVKELFEHAAMVHAKNRAIIFRDQSIDYEELNRRANGVAHNLIAAGVGRDEIIALFFYPSIEMIIGILAVIKSGAAYLPIEPDLPENRIDYLLGDCNVRILIHSNETTPPFPSHLKEIIVDCDASDWNPEIRTEPDSLAYVIYTSGSTGKPKGVLIEHRNLTAYISAFNSYFNVNNKDIFLQQASYSFDAFVEEIFPVLLAGGTVAVVPRDLSGDIARLRDYAEECRVTMVSTSPRMLNELDKMKNIESVHTYISGGDILKRNYIGDLLRRGKVFNTYGPTETTVCCSYYECRDDDESIPIGKPINGYEILVLDENKEPKPILIPGEIHIGGAGVARGYVNSPDLTLARFLPHPYQPNKTIYRSGDFGRFLADGNIEFLGRIDTQVKIRGYRIETEEIERALLKYDDLNEAVVVSRKSKDNEDELCAYFTSGKQLSVNQLRDYLSAILPKYMIPAYFIRLETMPVTKSGKINRAKLPEPYLLINTGAEYIEPSTPDEKILAAVIKNVLGVDRVSTSDRFLNLGGDSLKAVRVVGSLKEYNVSIGLSLLMKNLSFKELAACFERPESDPNKNNFEGNVKLHPYQIALFNYTFPHAFEDAVQWNTAGVFLSADQLDLKIVKTVAGELVRYHDALRSAFYKEAGIIKKCVQNAAAYDFDVLFFDFRKISDKPEKTILKEMKAIQNSFRLDRLFKMALFRTDGGDYIYFTGNHLITDAYSDNIIYEDFFNGYQQAIQGRKIKFFSKTDSYAKWIDKLYEYSKSPQLTSEIGYWKKIVNAHTTTIPKDFSQGSVGSVGQTLDDVADLVSELLDEKNTTLLKQYSFKNKRHILDILLCAWSLTISKLSGGRQTRVFCVNNGRNHFNNAIDVSRTVGLFMITYPVLIDLKEAQDPIKHLDYITHLLRDIPGQGFGYEILKFLTDDELKNSEHFQLPSDEKETSFNYVGEYAEDSVLSGFTIGKDIRPVYLIGDVNITRNKKALWTNDFNIFISVIENRLSVRFQYSVFEYKKESIQKAIAEFGSNIIALINHNGA